MIKGKFYTGLPSEMMARSRVVNRQNTNFFWPDETDMVSVADKSKRTPVKASSQAPAVTNFNNESDIKPKELFRKQLSSGIEFFDNVDAKTPESRRRRFKKIDNVNLNNNDGQYQPERKKLETFSSKIEFYDFEDGTGVKNERNGRNGRIEQPVKPMKNDINIDEVKQNKKDISELNKKRISFQAEEKTKGILKKSDDKSLAEKVVVKTLPKRGLLPKNMSKSVENISKMAKDAVGDDIKADKEPEKLSSIIKEVKLLNLSQERKPIYDRYERNENDNYNRRLTTDRYDDEPKWNNNNDYSGRDGRYRDEPDYYHFSERNYRNDGPRSPKYDDRYDDRRGRDREYNDSQQYERRQPQPREIYRERRYEERSRHNDESPIRERYTPEHRNYERDYERRSPMQRKPSDSYFDKPPRSGRYDEEYSTTTTTSSSSNRSLDHLPQHLRTNIVLGTNNVRLQTRRPISVRDSAVTRVGVGLPDYE